MRVKKFIFSNKINTDNIIIFYNINPKKRVEIFK